MLKLSSNACDMSPKVLKLSFEVSECKPLMVGGALAAIGTADGEAVVGGLAGAYTRSLFSST